MVPNNLIEIPIRIIGESDGNLSDDDTIIFYGRGPSGFNQKNEGILWHQNLYFTKTVYWLLIPANNSLRGSRIETANLVSESSEKINYGLSYIHSEEDLINPNESGLSWGNNTIKNGNSYSFKVNIDSPFDSQSAKGIIASTEDAKTKHSINNRSKIINKILG